MIVIFVFIVNLFIISFNSCTQIKQEVIVDKETINIQVLDTLVRYKNNDTLKVSIRLINKSNKVFNIPLNMHSFFVEIYNSKIVSNDMIFKNIIIRDNYLLKLMPNSEKTVKINFSKVNKLELPTDTLTYKLYCRYVKINNDNSKYQCYFLSKNYFMIYSY